MPTAISGVRSTTSIQSARRIVDMWKYIVLLEDDKKSLFTMAGALNKRKVTNPDFNWLTDEIVPHADALNGSITSAATTITVDNGGYFVANDIIKIPATGETMRVTGVASNVLTVTRTWGTTAAASAADNAVVLKIGSAFGENSTLRDSSDNLLSATTSEVSNQNYCQIFRDAFGLSETENSSDLYGGKDRDLQRRKKLIEHCQKINESFYHGEKAISGNVRTTGGVLEAKGSANFDSTNIGTVAAFETALETMFRYGSQEKVLFCGRSVSRAITATLAAGQQRITPGETKYGVRIRNYMSDSGDVKIVTDHALEGYYADYGVLMDMDDVALAHMPGRDTKLKVGVQLPDQDGVVDEYLSEVGLQWGETRKHGVFSDFNA